MLWCETVGGVVEGLESGSVRPSSDQGGGHSGAVYCSENRGVRGLVRHGGEGRTELNMGMGKQGALCDYF